MKTLLLKISALSLIALVVVSSASSCRKKETCEGKVRVLDSISQPVNGAKVKLAAPSVNGQVTYEAMTDGSGYASFEIKLPAIFDVTATKATYPGKVGTGILRVDEPGKKDEVTVRLR
jgi:hypothetical protein